MEACDTNSDGKCGFSELDKALEELELSDGDVNKIRWLVENTDYWSAINPRDN